METEPLRPTAALEHRDRSKSFISTTSWTINHAIRTRHHGRVALERIYSREGIDRDACTNRRAPMEQCPPFPAHPPASRPPMSDNLKSKTMTSQTENKSFNGVRTVVTTSVSFDEVLARLRAQMGRGSVQDIVALAKTPITEAEYVREGQERVAGGRGFL